MTGSARAYPGVVPKPSPVSFASTPQVRRRMQRQRSWDTGPELVLRRALYGQGLRYRLHARPLPELRRQADILFRPAKVAVFVHGCFWHACPRHGTQPKANARWWREKLERNRSRDRDTSRRLRREGWHVVRVWEHDVGRHAEGIAVMIRAAVRERTPL